MIYLLSFYFSEKSYDFAWICEEYFYWTKILGSQFSFFQYINIIPMILGLPVSHETFVIIIFDPLYIHNENFSLAAFQFLFYFLAILLWYF